jgi:hypothetical protein
MARFPLTLANAKGALGCLAVCRWCYSNVREAMTRLNVDREAERSNCSRPNGASSIGLEATQDDGCAKAAVPATGKLFTGTEH